MARRSTASCRIREPPRRAPELHVVEEESTELILGVDVGPGNGGDGEQAAPLVEAIATVGHVARQLVDLDAGVGSTLINFRQGFWHAWVLLKCRRHGAVHRCQDSHASCGKDYERLTHSGTLSEAHFLPQAEGHGPVACLSPEGPSENLGGINDGLDAALVPSREPGIRPQHRNESGQIQGRMAVRLG